MKDFFLNIRYRIEYVAVLVLYGMIRLLPHGALRIPAILGGAGVWLMPTFRRMIIANIRTAMPEKSEAEAVRIGRRSCYHVIFNLFEFIWLSGNPRRIERWYELPEDITARLKAHVAAGERIIFVNPHLGSWEASGLMAPYYAGVRMVAIAKPVRNPYLNRLLNHGNREKEAGLHIIFARGAIRAATRALREGLGVGTLIDQNTRVRDGGVFVRFFGMPVASSKAPASLKHYCNAHGIPSVIIYGTSVRMPDGRVRAHAEWLSRPFDQYESEEAVIQELMDISAGYIRRFPEQYLWFYRRFRYIPPECPEELLRRYPYYARVVKPSFFNRRGR